MDILNTTAGKIIVAVVVIVLLIILYNVFFKEGLDALPDTSTMIFGILPQSKTVARAVSAGGWAH
jgi:hypothetical protein